MTGRLRALCALCMLTAPRLVGSDQPYHIQLSTTGNQLYAEHRYQEAAEAYKTALEHTDAKDPDYAAIASNLGLAVQKMGNLELAKKLFQQALYLNPSLTHVYRKLANIHQQEGELGLAVDHFRAAIRCTRGGAVRGADRFSQPSAGWKTTRTRTSISASFSKRKVSLARRSRATTAARRMPAPRPPRAHAHGTKSASW